MARFDVCRLTDGNLVVDVQADLLEELRTRIVIPLLKFDQAPKPAKYLNPVFEIDAQQYVLKTEFLSAVDKALLSKPIMNLGAKDTDITRALDMAFQGF
ncbi:MAG: CcdB family protein [Pseudomonadota bacterium]